MEDWIKNGWYDGSKFDQVMDFEFNGNMVGKADQKKYGTLDDWVD